MAPAAALRKRRPADDLEGEQRLAKRFDGLHLDRDHHRPAKRPHRYDNHNSSDDDEWMHVDATAHKVYIPDLDKELESDSDSEHPIFVPDIEKHLLKVPKHVLIDDNTKAQANMQLVLYGAPASLSVPRESDSVRRAILEARVRAREEQALRPPELRPRMEFDVHRTNGIPNGISGVPNGVHKASPGWPVVTNGYRDAGNSNGAGEDPDAMDVD